MIPVAREEWRDQILLSRTVELAGERAELFSRVRGGDLLSLYRGVYFPLTLWDQLDRDARYRARIHAAAIYSPRPVVFSHDSAAALWRLPRLGEWPSRAHVVQPIADGGRSNAMFARHSVGLPIEIEAIEGLAVTTLARTVVDLAAGASFGQSVTLADAALRRTEHPLSGIPLTTLDKSDLYQELDGIPLRRGSARVRRTIDFADGRADRPGESLSRVSMHVAGITPPQLQVALRGATGREYFADFWWEEFDMIGEFDGRFKYTDPAFLLGRTPEQVLLDEKAREDDLRAAGHGMSRWPWEIALSPTRLREHLGRAGVR
ncbi:hypothetical protein [Glaciihabitans sp. UYNi722]|uniref:hypothetical protein n=1 Tax=Glaciihabitans sp. UYNi722 TaxID=3156344 RepID=UPI00339A3975